MSDALLERQAVALEGILALLKKAPVLGLPTGGAVAPTKTVATAAAATKPAGDPNALASDSTKTAAEKKAAADKAIAARKAAKEAAAAPAAATTKPPAASTKAAGGKHTVDQVRTIIRKVAEDLTKQSALDILADDGGGVTKVIDLKPEFYDSVYEACEVLLAAEGEKGAAAPAAEEDDFA